jgi:hypothetical protein
LTHEGKFLLLLLVKPAPVLLCLPQIPQALNWARTLAATVWIHWLIVCAVIRP